tara:strand:- start:171 stop:518 length:348 start_codon:yes stop_codon:yes gene_type:complete
MCTRSKIIFASIVIASCSNPKPCDPVEENLDTVLYRSEHNTFLFEIMSEDVDSFENVMWDKVEHKIDSLIQRNKHLEKKMGKSVRVVDKDGKVKNLGTIEEIKKRLIEKRKSNSR